MTSFVSTAESYGVDGPKEGRASEQLWGRGGELRFHLGLLFEGLNLGGKGDPRRGRFSLGGKDGKCRNAYTSQVILELPGRGVCLPILEASKQLYKFCHAIRDQLPFDLSEHSVILLPDQQRLFGNPYLLTPPKQQKKRHPHL